MKFTELSALFGEDTAHLICEELGGDTVYIPRPSPSLKADIAGLWGEGLTSHAIAERLGCSERHVRRVVGE